MRWTPLAAAVSAAALASCVPDVIRAGGETSAASGLVDEARAELAFHRESAVAAHSTKILAIEVERHARAMDAIVVEMEGTFAGMALMDDASAALLGDLADDLARDVTLFREDSRDASNVRELEAVCAPHLETAEEILDRMESVLAGMGGDEPYDPSPRP